MKDNDKKITKQRKKTKKEELIKTNWKKRTRNECAWGGNKANERKRRRKRKRRTKTTTLHCVTMSHQYVMFNQSRGKTRKEKNTRF